MPIDSLQLVGVVQPGIAAALAYACLILALALVAWLYRSLVEADPDPFLLNLTLFAGIGQAVLVVDSYYTRHFSGRLIVLSLAAMLVIILQIFTFRKQVYLTRAHYKKLLLDFPNKSAQGNEREHWAGHWAEVAVKLTGVDFYPEFYENLTNSFDNRRAERRVLAHALFPGKYYNTDPAKGGFGAESLTVPAADRQGPWRAYAVLCGLAWVLFLLSSLIVRTQ